jgi:hypothetical protein
MSGDTPPGEVASYFVTFHAVPNPHPDMKRYRGTWDPKAGLIAVSASSEVFEDDPRARGARSLYERLKRQLSSVYGSCDAVEFLDDGAIWDGENEFVKSLLTEERTHMSVWSEKAGSKLDSGIKEIFLMIGADREESSEVTILYNFVDSMSTGPGEDVGLSSL